MGSTYVDYHKRGFEANDGQLEVLLLLMVKEIDTLRERQQWLDETRDEWHLQATAGFGFGVMPGLDRVVQNEDQRRVLIAVAERVLKKLESYGPQISREDLNALGTYGTFLGDVDAVVFIRTARYSIKLLEGTLEPWESDARFSG